MLIILKHCASGSLLVYLWRLDLGECNNRLFSELSNPGSQGNCQSHTCESHNSPTSLSCFFCSPWKDRFMHCMCIFPVLCMSGSQIIKVIINWDWHKQVVSSLPTWLGSARTVHTTNPLVGHQTDFTDANPEDKSRFQFPPWKIMCHHLPVICNKWEPFSCTCIRHNDSLYVLLSFFQSRFWQCLSIITIYYSIIIIVVRFRY